MKKKTLLRKALVAPAIVTFTATASIAIAGCSGSGSTAETTTSEAEETTTTTTAAATTTSAAAAKLEGSFPDVAGENGTDYINLFEVILASDYDEYWVDKCAEVIGEDGASEAAEMLKNSISRTVYGEEAISAYTEAPENIGFDCWYINDAESFLFDGSDVTITKTDGTSESHTYEYVGTTKIGEGETMNYNGEEIDPSFECDTYKSTDDAGEFTYILLRDDTMDSTYHIEFRYGSDLDQLKGYFTGDYAYWLAAGIDKNADEDTVHNVIDLFITENLAGE